jgi:chromosome segregation ATPase
MSGNKVQKAIELPKEQSSKIKETKALIFNESQDLDMKVNEILEDQQELLSELKGVNIISPELAREVRNKNLQLKEQVLSQTVRTQELINEAEDLNDYRDIIQKQNKMIDNTTKAFVEIDNELSERQVKETEKLEKIQENIGRELVNMVEQIGGRAEDLEMLEHELDVSQDDIEMLMDRLSGKIEEIGTLKLTLEKSESKEQKLKQQLTEMESIIDKMENQNITQPLSPLQEAEKFLADRKK